MAAAYDDVSDLLVSSTFPVPLTSHTAIIPIQSRPVPLSLLVVGIGHCPIYIHIHDLPAES